MKIRAIIAILLFPLLSIGGIAYYDTMTSIGTNAGIAYYEIPLGQTIIAASYWWDSSTWCTTFEINEDPFIPLTGTSTVANISMTYTQPALGLGGYVTSGSSYYGIIAAGSDTIVDSVANITIAGWARFDSFTDATFAGSRIFTLQRGAGGTLLGLGASSSGKVAAMTLSGSTAKEILGSDDISLFVWHHIAVVKTGASHQLYLDGKTNGTPASWTPSVALSGHSAYVGNDGNLSRFTTGDIGDVSVWSNALSNAQVESLFLDSAYQYYSYPSYLYLDTDSQRTNVLACLVFQEDQEVVQDVSWSGNDGTRSNTTWTTDGTNAWMDFDGSTGYVDSADIGTVKTLSFWINAHDTDGRVILDIDGTNYVNFSSGGSANVQPVSWPSATVYTDGTAGAGPVASNTWTHVCITDSTGVSASTFEVGRVGASYYDGAIDDLYAFSTELTAGQVMNLTTNGSHYSP